MWPRKQNSLFNCVCTEDIFHPKEIWKDGATLMMGSSIELRGAVQCRTPKGFFASNLVPCQDLNASKSQEENLLSRWWRGCVCVCVCVRESLFSLLSPKDDTCVIPCQ